MVICNRQGNKPQLTQIRFADSRAEGEGVAKQKALHDQTRPTKPQFKAGGAFFPKIKIIITWFRSIALLKLYVGNHDPKKHNRGKAIGIQ